MQNYVKKFIPLNVLEEIWPDLVGFGSKVVGEYIEYAEDAERFKPIFEKYDAWGKYVKTKFNFFQKNYKIISIFLRFLNKIENFL
jgi:hypothetical protein